MLAVLIFCQCLCKPFFCILLCKWAYLIDEWIPCFEILLLFHLFTCNFCPCYFPLFSQLCSGSELMNGLRGKNYKTTNHLRSIEPMFSFATILLRKSSNLAKALTTMMSTKNSNMSTNRIWNLSLDWKIFSPGGDLHSLIVSMALSVTSYLCLSFLVRFMAYYSYYCIIVVTSDWDLCQFYECRPQWRCLHCSS